MTLLNLETATGNSPTSNSNFEEYLPQDDQAEFQRFFGNQSGFATPVGEVLDESNGL